MSNDIVETRQEPLVKIDCKQDLIRAVRFNADGQYAMTCGSDRTLKLWRPTKLLQLKCYKGHSADVLDCQIKWDNSQFISCSQDKSVIVWDVETGKIVRRFRNLTPFSTICYGQEATTLFAGTLDGTVKIYDLRALNAWDAIQNLTEANDSITCCRIYKHTIFTTSLDKCLRSYDIRQGQLFVDNLNVALNCVTPSQDGATLLVGCLRGSIVLVDRVGGKLLNKYSGNENKLFKLESSFAMKDTLVVGGSENGHVYVWDCGVAQEDDGKPKLALKHPNSSTTNSMPVISSISSDSLDHLLTACSTSLFMWSIG